MSNYLFTTQNSINVCILDIYNKEIYRSIMIEFQCQYNIFGLF